jgi:hypothetical protein
LGRQGPPIRGNHSTGAHEEQAGGELATKHWWPVLETWRRELAMEAQATQQKWPKLEYWRWSLQLEHLATKHWWPSLELAVLM